MNPENGVREANCCGNENPEDIDPNVERGDPKPPETPGKKLAKI